MEGDISAKREELAGLDPATAADQIAALQGEISALEGRQGELNGQISSLQSDYDGTHRRGCRANTTPSPGNSRRPRATLPPCKTSATRRLAN